MEKISICLELLRTYRHIFDETLKQMRMAGEPEWNFSEKYVFGQTNQLVDRLSKVSFYFYIYTCFYLIVQDFVETIRASEGERNFLNHTHTYNIQSMH